MQGMKGAVLGAVLALAGCSTTTNVGRAVDTNAAAQLQPGQTTISQAQALLGAPFQTVTTSDGRTVLTYAHTTVKQHGLFGANADVASQSLVLVFGADGKLIKSTAGNQATRVQQ